MRVVIVGAGGHGQVVADIFAVSKDAKAATEVVGYVDDRSSLLDTTFMGVPVLGSLALLDQIDFDALVVAVGDNETRAALTRSLESGGAEFAVARHPSAILARGVTLGDGSMVCAGVIVNTGSRVGCGVILNTGCTVDHHTAIGDFAHIAPGVHMGGEVEIGERAFVGIGAVVLPRVRLGAGSTVGAGAVVTRDVPAGATVTGVPARIVRPRLAIGRHIA